MRIRTALACLCTVLFPGLLWAEVPGGPFFSYGADLGYYGGVGGQLSVTVSSFAQDFPLHARLGMGYTAVDPGIAADARRIFINDATDGTPEEHGRIWDLRLDLLYPVRLLSLRRAYIFGGPRYSRFTGNFKFIGGNEDFDVQSRQWGVGAGFESHFAMSPRVDLILSGGFDYLPAGTLSGHDTSYNPDGDNVNPQEDFTYDDADAAINQPKRQVRLMLGFRYNY